MAWARENGERPLTAKKLGFSLRQRGFLPERSARTRYWTGLQLVAG
jgi:hypothetical protein